MICSLFLRYSGHTACFLSPHMLCSFLSQGFGTFSFPVLGLLFSRIFACLLLFTEALAQMSFPQEVCFGHLNSILSLSPLHSYVLMCCYFICMLYCLSLPPPPAAPATHTHTRKHALAYGRYLLNELKKKYF